MTEGFGARRLVKPLGFEDFACEDLVFVTLGIGSARPHR